jgi:hypothetical protein
MRVSQLELDLFGKQAELAEWLARFERADWVAPHDTQGGMKKGDRQPGGWVCPSCGQVEPNQFLLGTNHGWDPDRPHLPFGHGRYCVRQYLQRNHAAYDERMRVEEGRLL